MGGRTPPLQQGYRVSHDPFKHHRRSIRLRGYDYSQVGTYFVTICAMNRECIFGEVANGIMHPSQIGEIVLKWWNELTNYYRPAKLDEFLVMPNHMHGIIVIGESSGSASRLLSDKRTLGQLVGYVKFQITKEINRIRDRGYSKVLQRDYYEHIIRNEREWNLVAEYIRNNPVNWREDLDNPANFPKRPPPKTSDEYWQDAEMSGRGRAAVTR